MNASQVPDPNIRQYETARSVVYEYRISPFQHPMSPHKWFLFDITTGTQRTSYGIFVSVSMRAMQTDDHALTEMAVRRLHLALECDEADDPKLGGNNRPSISRGFDCMIKGCNSFDENKAEIESSIEAARQPRTMGFKPH